MKLDEAFEDIIDRINNWEGAGEVEYEDIVRLLRRAVREVKVLSKRLVALGEKGSDEVISNEDLWGQ